MRLICFSILCVLAVSCGAAPRYDPSRRILKVSFADAGAEVIVTFAQDHLPEEVFFSSSVSHPVSSGLVSGKAIYFVPGNIDVASVKKEASFSIESAISEAPSESYRISEASVLFSLGGLKSGKDLSVVTIDRHSGAVTYWFCEKFALVEGSGATFLDLKNCVKLSASHDTEFPKIMAFDSMHLRLPEGLTRRCYEAFVVKRQR